ncbi:MAG: hypothetical protein AB2806_00995 [Candidatus Thiodiazotropha sp.]
MGREVRRVAADWQHPVGEDGKFQPFFGGQMPNWKPGEATHYQMYETTTPGTPISPVMPSAQSLAHWLVEHQVSAFGEQTASYDAWLRVCQGHPAFSFAFERSRFVNGVENDYQAHKQGCDIHKGRVR